MDIDKPILKFMQTGERSRIVNPTLKENKIGGLTLLDFKSSYKATRINTVQCSVKKLAEKAEDLITMLCSALCENRQVMQPLDFHFFHLHNKGMDLDDLYYSQCSIVLAKEQTSKSMEENREFRYGPAHIQSTDF